MPPASHPMKAIYMSRAPVIRMYQSPSRLTPLLYSLQSLVSHGNIKALPPSFTSFVCYIKIFFNALISVFTSHPRSQSVCAQQSRPTRQHISVFHLEQGPTSLSHTSGHPHNLMPDASNRNDNWFHKLVLCQGICFNESP